jgi:peptidoglycan-N-acetylglucosamine deacetylase
MQNAFTVDVEEWFHVCAVDGDLAPANWDHLPSRVERTTDDLLALLDRCRVRATFFVLGWIAERHPSLIGRIAGAGHEIGSHGHSHTRIYELTREEFAAELRASVATLNGAGIWDVAGFRAPEWSINDRSLWALDVLAGAGFRFDSSMAPLRLIGNPAYPEIPHVRPTSAGPICEFPPLVGRRLGQNMPLGGGWGLRMTDPDRVVREIGRRNQRGEPVALFVHPWEIDDDPPRVRLPRARAFTHYFKLAGFRDRLEKILQPVEFGPMGEVLGLRTAV